MRTVLALILLAACGPAPSRSGNFQESISVVAVCSNNTYGWIVEVEEGVPGMPDVSCSGFARSFADYQERCIAAASSGLAGFGALGTVDTSRWTVRVRADAVKESGYVITGQTFFSQWTIDIYQGNPVAFVHELNHVALGPSSADHQPQEGPDGWCNFGLWEKFIFGLDEQAYLGCPVSQGG